MLIGLAPIAIVQSLAIFSRDWLSQVDPWLLIVLGGLIPQMFLLSFPILTRQPRRPGPFTGITSARFLIELAIAIPVAIGCIVTLSIVNYIIGLLWPGTSLTTEGVKDMVASPHLLLVGTVLTFSFTFAPIAEEVFFRGFLQGAFRARMPAFVAGLIQSLIFGVVHISGTVHSAIAFVLGLVLTLVYTWRKTLIAPILVHAGINFFSALGVAATMIATANSAVLGVLADRQQAGFVIQEVAPGSAAEKAQLQVGDRITSFNGKPILEIRQLTEAVRGCRPGDKVWVTVERGGSLVDIEAVLQQRGPRSSP